MAGGNIPVEATLMKHTYSEETHTRNGKAVCAFEDDFVTVATDYDYNNEGRRFQAERHTHT